MGLMPAMSEWVQANTSILWSRTYCICSLSAWDRRELTYVDLSSPLMSKKLIEFLVHLYDFITM